MTTGELVEELTTHRTFGSAPREELVWIAEHGHFREYAQGEIVSRESEVVNGMYIVLTGCITFYMQRSSGVRRVFESRGGDVTGLLPFSRMTTPPGTTIVEEPTRAVTIRREDLPEMIRHCYEITALLVHQMIDRARTFTSNDLRDEKMISLGKLAAGFAHEVNNPASAALRDATALAATMGSVEASTRSLWRAQFTADQMAALDILWSICSDSPAAPAVSGLALADREDDMTTWLESHDVDPALAGEIARTPASTGDLDRFAQAVGRTQLDAGLHWVAAQASARTLVTDIERAARRIHTLVTAAKGFTHMDRAPDLERFDLQPGLRDTVALLEGRARSKGISFALSIPDDLPPIRGRVVEINQVWMNLIDNAIDAAPEQGHVAVNASLEGADVIVTVADDGPGVPAELRESIFDPFFTTKPVGKGTGLGLDIARRVVLWHNGQITLESAPGRTEFRVRLPLGGAG
ncbi:MAG TPA: ATP-binding protein [Bacteroidota bacterium]|nr:ATP-binding protein [Bacteroidota bacterium]